MMGRKSSVRPLVWMIIWVLLMSIALGFSGQANASEGKESAAIGYYVRALLPENQIDPTVTYFDLRMKPSQKQDIIVEVVNETNEEITIDIAAISASTSRNGVIDYKTPDIKDETLAIAFSDIASLKKKQMSVPADSTAPVVATIAMPETPYDGVVLGGLVFTKQNEKADASSEGMVLNNIYSYVIGVKLSETDVPVLPDFELAQVQADTVNYLPTIVHSIRNKNAAIAKNIAIDVAIYDQKNQLVSEFQREGMDMAPNSVMPLAVTPANAQGAENDGRLVPGEYTSKLTLVQDEKKWEFEQKFVIESAEAERINDIAPIEPPAAANYTLLVIAAIVIFLLLALVIVLIVWMKSQKKKQS